MLPIRTDHFLVNTKNKNKHTGINKGQQGFILSSKSKNYYHNKYIETLAIFTSVMMLKMEAMEIQTGDEFDDDNESSCSSLRRRGCVLLAILTTVVTMSIGYILSTRNSVAHVADETDELIQLLSENIYSKLLPDELFEQRIYNNSDFVNKLGVTPAFWGQNETCDDLGNNCAKVWGPCYAKNNPHWKNKTQYLPISKSAAQYSINMDNLSGYCRPGFLIIGQGKCGTSSLYHYLVGHPRVLPANEKQIHYFKVRATM